MTNSDPRKWNSNGFLGSSSIQEDDKRTSKKAMLKRVKNKIKQSMKIYKIRTDVLCMTLEMWDDFHYVFGQNPETIQTNVAIFLECVGLPKISNLEPTDNEKEFFKDINELWRKENE